MLTNSQINKLKPKNSKYLIADFDGLYIQIYPTGRKAFLYIENINGRRIKKTIGEYSGKFDLNKARLAVQQLKTIAEITEIKTKDVISEWLNIKETKIKLKNLMLMKSALERSVVKMLGKRNFADLKRGEIIDAINMEFGAKMETKRRTLNNMVQIYNYAVMKDYIESNILFGVTAGNVFGKPNERNFPTITNLEKISLMFKSVVSSGAMPQAKFALILNCLTALRPGNIIALRWDNIELDNKIIVLKAYDMKMKKDFIVPLSKQALRVLEFLEKYHKYNDYVFASHTSKTGHISGNTTRKLLRDLGIENDDFTPHGFRSMFSTLANENGKDIDTIERCLAHAVGGVRGIYDRSEKLEQKRELMQWWGDFISPHLHINELVG